MKGIIIQDCLNCPFSDIEDPNNNGDSLICNIGVGNGKKVLCKMTNSIEFTIPDWCRLDELEEVVESAVLEYGIKCRGIIK